MNVNGWSVQYASAAGATWTATNLTNTTIQPGQYYLVQEGGGATGVPLPTPDAIGTIPMAGGAGKVALVNSTTALSGSCPTDASIIDKVGYGATASCFEGAGPAPAPSNTTSDLRANNGCTDTDDNAADFSTGAPNPRNTGSPVNVCPTPTPTPTPTATTDPATNITGNSATLNGTVNPNGVMTTVYFEYGTSTSYGMATANQTFNGTTAQSVMADISGLSLSTTYHYRIVAMSAGGTTFGADAMFTTLSALPPTVTTTAATNVTSTGATLNGTVNPNGATTMVHFEYGTTTSYGSTTSNQTFNGTTAQSVTAAISGLTPGTLYHFRLVGTNNGGTAFGSDMTFTTVQPAPTITTGAASNVTASTATVNGVVNPNGGQITTVHFEYGTTTSYGSITPNQTFTGTTSQNVMADITGLTPNTLYHFRLVGTNSGGTTNGNDVTFMTAAPTPTPTPTASPTPSPCPNTITHSLSQVIELGNSVACVTSGTNYHKENSYWRAFDMQHFAGGRAYSLNSVQFGVQQTVGHHHMGDCDPTTGNGHQPVDVRLYANNGAPFPNGVLTQLGQTASLCLADIEAAIVFVPASAFGSESIIVPAGTLELVMVVHTPNGVPYQDVFFIGSNSDGQTGPSYISAPECGLTTPTDLATVGYPNMDIVMNVNGACLGGCASPTVTTNAATNVTSASATLNGTVNPNGSATTVHFEYGITNYVSRTPNQTFNGIFTQNVSADLEGLLPNTVYHFRTIGSNTCGTAVGADQTFTTLPTPPPPPPPNPSCTPQGTLGTAPSGGATGTIPTRLFRGGNSTTCASAPFPGNFDTGPFIYNVHYISNNTASAVCSSVTLHLLNPGTAITNIQIAAFRAPFTAADITNPSRYLGDPGLSTSSSSIDRSFSVNVAANTTIALVVFNVTISPAGQGAIYQILLDQNLCGPFIPPAPYGIITDPTPCSTLSSTSAMFQWSAGTASTAYWLVIGDDNAPASSATPNPIPSCSAGCNSRWGASNIFSSSQTGGLSWNATNLPTDGRTLYVRLWSFVNRSWFPQDYIYHAAQLTGPNVPVISHPKVKKQTKVTILDATPCVTIYYTIGTKKPPPDPNPGSRVYTGPFVAKKGKNIIKAIAIGPDGRQSSVATSTFTVK